MFGWGPGLGRIFLFPLRSPRGAKVSSPSVAPGMSAIGNDDALDSSLLAP